MNDKKFGPWLKRQLNDSFTTRSETYYKLLKRLNPEEKLSMSEALNGLKTAGYSSVNFPKRWQSYQTTFNHAIEYAQLQNYKDTLYLALDDGLALYRTECELAKEGLRLDPDSIYTFGLLVENGYDNYPNLKRFLPLAIMLGEPPTI